MQGHTRESFKESLFDAAQKARDHATQKAQDHAAQNAYDHADASQDDEVAAAAAVASVAEAAATAELDAYEKRTAKKERRKAYNAQYQKKVRAKKAEDRAMNPNPQPKTEKELERLARRRESNRRTAKARLLKKQALSSTVTPTVE